jgi:hypothetical protein
MNCQQIIETVMPFVATGWVFLWVGFMLGEINSIKRADRHREELRRIQRGAR